MQDHYLIFTGLIRDLYRQKTRKTLPCSNGDRNTIADQNTPGRLIDDLKLKQTRNSSTTSSIKQSATSTLNLRKSSIKTTKTVSFYKFINILIIVSIELNMYKTIKPDINQ